MRVLVQNTLTNRQWVAFDSPAGFTVGRDGTCDVKLDSRFVSGTHVKVERSEVGWALDVLPGVSAVDVNGSEVKAGQSVRFRDQAILKLMEFVLTLEEAQQTGAAGEVDEQITDLFNVLHANVLRRLDLRLGAITSVDISQNRTDQLNKIIDDLLLTDFRREVFQSEMTPVITRVAMRAGQRLADSEDVDGDENRRRMAGSGGKFRVGRASGAGGGAPGEQGRHLHRQAYSGECG